MLTNQANFATVIHDIFEPIQGDDILDADVVNNEKRTKVMNLATKYIDVVQQLKASVHQNAVNNFDIF